MQVAHAARLTLRRMTGDTREVHGVRIILERDGRIFLVRHWYAPGVWTLPGGGINRGETINEAAIREVKEETGYTVGKIEGTVGIYLGKKGEGDKAAVVFTRDFSGSMRLLPDREVFERGFFALDELPENVSPANKKRILEYSAGERNLTRAW